MVFSKILYVTTVDCSWAVIIFIVVLPLFFMQFSEANMWCFISKEIETDIEIIFFQNLQHKTKQILLGSVLLFSVFHVLCFWVFFLLIFFFLFFILVSLFIFNFHFKSWDLSLFILSEIFKYSTYHTHYNKRIQRVYISFLHFWFQQ